MGDKAGKERSRPSGMDRRTLIKSAAAAGVAAWTAPIILESVTSPAAAQSGGTLFRIQFAGTCSLHTPDANPTCAPSGWTSATDYPYAGGHIGCPNTTDIAGTPACIQRATCPNADCFGGIELDMGSGTGCTCTFVSGRASDSNGACFDGVVSNAGKTLTFSGAPSGLDIGNYYILISCG